MIPDHLNLRALIWTWLYCFLLVLGVSLLRSLHVPYTVIVPLAIVVLPILVSMPFLPHWNRSDRRAGA